MASRFYACVWLLIAYIAVENIDAFIDPYCAEEGEGRAEAPIENQNQVYDAVYFDNLVKKTYEGNVNNANKILSVNPTSKLDLKMSIFVLSSLYNAMKTHGHLNSYQLLMLAFKVKHVYQHVEYETLDETTKDTLQILKDSLPVEVVNFVKCGNMCTLLNHKHNETIYAEEDYVKQGANRRNVYTWIPRNDNSNRFYWDFEAVNDGEYFKLKNVQLSEYLFASKVAPVTYTKGIMRNVFTAPSEVDVPPEALWRVTPTDNGKHFSLQNIRYKGEFLYASGNKDLSRDSYRRGVLTCRGKNETDLQQVDGEQDWNFDCSDNCD